MDENKIAIFEGKQIRKTLHHGEWWFVVEDIVLALIDSNDPKQYIQRMKLRDPELAKGMYNLYRPFQSKPLVALKNDLC